MVFGTAKANHVTRSLSSLWHAGISNNFLTAAEHVLTSYRWVTTSESRCLATPRRGQPGPLQPCNPAQHLQLPQQQSGTLASRLAPAAVRVALRAHGRAAAGATASGPCGLATSRVCRLVHSSAAAAARRPDSNIDSVECVVIGAGVIGLAVARALAARGREVVVVEAAGAVGTETSSRHSEVIHAGIYYPPGSLKARMCVEGKARLYDYCRTHNVPYKNITKLIVATSKEQLPDLVSFRAAAARHGVPDLQLLSGAEARGLEPALAAEGALLSPSTGILDSHTFMSALLADAEALGAVLALNTRVAGGWLEQAHLTTTTTTTTTTTSSSPAPSSSSPAPSSSSPAPSSSSPAPSSSSPAPSSSSPAPSSSPASTTTDTRRTEGLAAAAAGGAVPYKVLELHSLHPAGSDDGGGGGDGSSSGGGGGGGAAAAAVAAARPVVEVSRLRARWVVNAAGLHAMAVAAGMAGLQRSSIPRLYLAKGNYFSLSVRSPFSRLIYPMPERGLAGLGTHLTLDMAGGARFGPDVEWLLPGPGPDPAAPVHLDYRVDMRRAESFYPAIRRFYPALPGGALQPAYSGVRPKLSGPGEPPADFVVQGAREGHGVRGWVNLYGIESPGLTSSLALAEYVCDVLDKS